MRSIKNVMFLGKFDANMVVRILIFLISAIAYCLFYALNEPELFNSSAPPIALAIKNNDTQSFISLIETADLKMKSGTGQTILSLAVREVNYTFTQNLLDMGANPNARSDFADRPVIYEAAASVCYPSFDRSKEVALRIVKLLIRFGADVNARNYNGEPAIIWAAKCGSAQLASLLIDNGANVNIVSNRSAAPLHQAIHESRRSKSFETIETLILAGANPYVKNSDQEFGKSAIEWAKIYKDNELLRILEESNSKAVLEADLSGRASISYKSRRIKSKLYEYGISVPVTKINIVANNTIYILFLPSILALLAGLARRDKPFLYIGAVQVGIISTGAPIVLIIAAASGS